MSEVIPLTRIGKHMKLIIAVIKPEVREKLTKIGIQGLMVSEIKGFVGKGTYRNLSGAEYIVNYIPKIRLEIVVPRLPCFGSSRCDFKIRKNWEIGYGKIFVLNVEDAIRTRETTF